MSTQITEIYYQEPTASDTLIRAHIDCDTAAELPAANAYSGYSLLMGCTADVIQTGDRYKMQSDGTWVRQPIAQSDAYTTMQTDTLLSERIPYELTNIISSGADLNDYTQPGSWRCTSTSVTNYPPTTAQGRLDVIEVDSLNGLMQQQLRCVGALSRVYIRTMSAASPPAWHPWVEVDMVGRLGTSIPSGSDLDTYRAPGKYYSPSVSASQNAIHRPDYTPTTNIRFYMSVDIGASTSMFVQTLHAVDVSTANYGVLRVFRRVGNDTTWGSWYETTLTPIGSHT